MCPLRFQRIDHKLISVTKKQEKFVQNYGMTAASRSSLRDHAPFYDSGIKRPHKNQLRRRNDRKQTTGLTSPTAFVCRCFRPYVTERGKLNR
jgi:hypothetical protein